MSQQALTLLSQSVVCPSLVTVRRFVDFTGAQAVTLGQNVLGVAEQACTVINTAIPVAVIGTAIVEAGGVLSAGEAVVSDASGRAVVQTLSTQSLAGYVMPGQSASAAGQFVEILLTN